jgi:dipeptidyl aminopeptidase/acylaminoacyl peptidase
MQIRKTVFIAAFALISTLAVFSVTAQSQTELTAKPKLTLDEFFNAVSFTSVELSPDGKAVVIGTERADWDQQIFRQDLWLWRETDKTDDAKPDKEKTDKEKTGKEKTDRERPGSLIQLTQSGHDSEPKWSPDGRWIAFLSERKTAAEKSDDADSDPDAKDTTAQLYLISPTGGEAFPITQGEEEVHAFSWSADSAKIYFATRQPWTKSQKDDYKKEWKDVTQYRTAERGDTIFSLDLADAIARHAAAPAKI